MDHPKVVILEQNGSYYDSVPFPVFDSVDENLRERNYSFNSFSTDSLVTDKTVWCIKATSCSNIPSYMDSDIPTRKCSDRIRWNCREEGVMWNDVVSQEWSFDDNLKVLMNNGEALSLYGITGACNLNKFTQESVREATYLVYRLLDNQRCVGDELKVDNIMRHHTGEIVLHRMHQGNLIFPLYPFDVDNGLLNNCPNVIVEDHIHCWNAMDERLVGIGVTSPLFSDGFADYSFSNIGPVWLSILMPLYVHSVASDFRQ